MDRPQKEGSNALFVMILQKCSMLAFIPFKLSWTFAISVV